MRIAFIVHQFPALSETFILNQITGLIDRGHQVDIYAKHLGDTAKMHVDVESYRLLNQTSYLRVPVNRFVRGLNGLKLLMSCGLSHPGAVLGSLNVFAYGREAASLRLLYAAEPWLQRGSYDIIHCQFGTLGHLGAMLRNLYSPSAKLITSFRGFDISQQLRKYGDAIYERLFEVGDLFLPNCEYFKERLVKLGCDKAKILVLRSGIDCHRFAFSARYARVNCPVRIVTTGRLTGKKGIEYGIRGVAQLLKAGRNIRYDIIGDGPLKEDLEGLIDHLGVGSAVRLLGWKQQSEIIEILAGAQLFMAPSVTSTQGDQDAPVNVLKEAMAMGMPVIGTRHGGIPELVEDYVSGLLVPERDSESLANKLSYLLDHPEVWPGMGRAGRLRVEQEYDINKLNDHLFDVYRQLSGWEPSQPVVYRGA